MTLRFLPSTSSLLSPSLLSPVVAIALAMTAAACSSSSSTTPPADAGQDTGSSPAPSPPVLDAGPDATVADGGVVVDGSGDDDDANPPDDAGDDASDDAGSDGGPDAGSDAPTGTPLPVLLAPGVANATLAVDDSFVYFTTGSGVSGVAKSGGPVFVVAQTVGSTTGGVLHLESGVLYWDPAAWVGANSDLRSINRGVRNGQSTLVGNFGEPAIDFTVSGSTAYAGSSCLVITALPILVDGGGAPSVISAPGCNRMPQWLSFQLDATNGTLDALDNYPYQIDRYSIAAGTRSSFAVDPTTVLMTVHGQTIYWVTVPGCSGDGGCAPSALHASALDGSNPVVVATGPWQVGFNQGAFGPITDTYAFLLVEGGIVRITLATGENHVVYTPLGAGATGVPATGSVAADDTSLYVVDGSLGLLSLSN